MKSALKTAPAKYPLELDAVKEHMNITVGWTEDDEYIKTLLYTATKKAEQYLRRRLITQTWYTYYDAWPIGTDEIILPFGKLQASTAPILKYTDIDGTQTTWSSDEWNADTDADPGRITLEYGYTWPTVTLAPQNPIVIEFVCGYGDTGDDIEDSIKHAMKLIIDDLYNNRGDIVIGTITSNMKIVGDLLMPYRLHDIPTE